MLKANGVTLTSGAPIVISKKISDYIAKPLTSEELAAHGFTPDQNFVELPLSALDALGYSHGSPQYVLSLNGMIEPEDLEQLSQVASFLIKQLLLAERNAAPSTSKRSGPAAPTDRD